MTDQTFNRRQIRTKILDARKYPDSEISGCAYARGFIAGMYWADVIDDKQFHILREYVSTLRYPAKRAEVK